MTFRKTLIGSATIAALLAAPLAPAFAQTAEAPAAGQPQLQEDMQQAQTEFTDTQLESFVTAAMAVTEIRQDYMAKMQSAESEDAATQLQTEALAEMQAAVEDTENMDLDTYNQIGQAMQSDPEVGERVAALIKAQQPDGATDSETQGEG